MSAVWHNCYDDSWKDEPVVKKTARLSFFRRLHQKKYPHLAIEWEDIIVTRRH